MDTAVQPLPESRIQQLAERLRRHVLTIVRNDEAALRWLIFLVIGCTACLMPAQNDTWWHLRAGEDVWAGRSVSVEHYSHTEFGKEWINREWLTQWLFFLLYSVGGMPLLSGAIAAAALASMVLMSRLLVSPPLWRTVSIAVALSVVVHQWSLRPQVMTLALLMLCVYSLHKSAYRWLPLLFLVWANLHGGVILGMGVLVAVTCAYHLVRRPDRYIVTAVTVASALATLFNPLGLRLWTDLPGAIQRNKAAGILEFQPPQLGDLSLLPFWAALVVFVALAVKVLRSRPAIVIDPVIVAATVLAIGGLMASRNTAAAMLLMTAAIDRLRVTSPPLTQAKRPGHPRLNAALVSVATLTGAVVVSLAWAARAPRLDWDPVAAPALQALERCGGNLYNRFDDGGYLVWFAKNRPVFIDSRFDPYDSGFIARHVEVERTGNYGTLFQRYGISCAFLPADSLVSARLLKDGWELRYQDARWVIVASKAEA